MAVVVTCWAVDRGVFGFVPNTPADYRDMFAVTNARKQQNHKHIHRAGGGAKSSITQQEGRAWRAQHTHKRGPRLARAMYQGMAAG